MIHAYLEPTPTGIALAQVGSPDELQHEQAERTHLIVELMGLIAPCYQLYVVTDRDRERLA